MVWTAPRTWYAGETVTSAMLNAQLRDNLNVLKTRISDAGELDVSQVNLADLADGASHARRATLAASDADGATSGAGATDVWSYTLPAGGLEDGEELLFEAAGDCTGDGNNKIMNFQVGATSWSRQYTGAFTSWSLFARVRRISAAVQRGYLTIHWSDLGSGVVYAAGTVDLDSSAVVKLTLTHATSGVSTLRTVRLRREPAVA